MADISQSRSSLEALRGVLNRERIKEIKEGAGMRKAFKAAETALEAYAKAREELRFADAGPLAEKAAEAVEAAWSHYRKLEMSWAFDQVAKVRSSLNNLARHPSFPVRRFFHAGLRQVFQTANDKLAFIETWKSGTDKSDVLRQHVRDVWDSTNAAWDMDAAIGKSGGLPGSWLFRSPILDVLNTEAKKLAKAADDIIKAQASAEGKPAPAKIKAREYTWEVVVAMDEADFQLALPAGDKAAATRERITAQRALAVKLDAKGYKVETLYTAYKAGKLNGGLTEGEITLITARFVAFETPKEERRKPATSPEALAVADLKADAAAGNSIAVVLLRLDERENGKDKPVPAVEEEVGLDNPAFAGFIVAEAQKAKQSAEQVLAKLAADPAALSAARAAYAQFLAGGNGNGKKPSVKKVQKDDGKVVSEEKNAKGSKKPTPRRSRMAVAETEE